MVFTYTWTFFGYHNFYFMFCACSNWKIKVCAGSLLRRWNSPQKDMETVKIILVFLAQNNISVRHSKSKQFAKMMVLSLLSSFSRTASSLLAFVSVSVALLTPKF